MFALRWLNLLVLTSLLVLAPTPGLGATRLVEADTEVAPTEVIAALPSARALSRTADTVAPGNRFGPPPVVVRSVERQPLALRSAPLHVLHCVWRE
jgi:hypothetical protein